MEKIELSFSHWDNGLCKAVFYRKHRENNSKVWYTHLPFDGGLHSGTKPPFHEACSPASNPERYTCTDRLAVYGKHDERIEKFDFTKHYNMREVEYIGFDDQRIKEN